MNKLSVALMLICCIMACRNSSSDLTKVAGEYQRKSDEQFARVTVTLYVKLLSKESASFTIEERTVIVRKDQPAGKPAQVKNRTLTGRYDPVKKQLFIEDRGLTYEVEPGKRLFTATEQLNRVSDHTEPPNP